MITPHGYNSRSSIDKLRQSKTRVLFEAHFNSMCSLNIVALISPAYSHTQRLLELVTAVIRLFDASGHVLTLFTSSSKLQVYLIPLSTLPPTEASA